MPEVSTSSGTFVSDLFNPEVVGQMIDEKLVSNIVFAPLATIDYTLQGRAGDTVTLPYFDYIGDAEIVEEGKEIPVSKLSTQTKKVTISKIGKGVWLTDEAMLSGYGDPIGEAVRQIVLSLSSKVDNMLMSELNGNTKNVYTPSGTLTPDDIRKALALFGEENEGPKAIIVDPDFYAELLEVKSWIPASEIAANAVIQGAVGMAYGCQVIVSERVKNNNFHIVKPGALAIFMKRDVLVESERSILNQSTLLTGSRLFAPYLYKPVSAIKILNGSASGSVKLSGLTIGSLTLTPAFNAGTTSYTVSTSNSTNTISATAEDSSASITIKNGETVITNGTSATWSAGENTLTITVTNGTESKVYTVTVTKS